MSPRDELRLIGLAQRGDLAARNALLERHASFMWSVCIRFARRGRAEPAELVSYAVEAFINAIRLFDRRRGCKLITYAGQAMKLRIINHLYDNRVIRVPPMQDNHNRALYERRSVAAMNVASLDLDEGRIRAGLLVDDTCGPGPAETAQRHEETAALRAAIERLPDHLRVVIKKRLQGMMLREIADELGLTRQGIQIRESVAHRRLAAMLAGYGAIDSASHARAAAQPRLSRHAQSRQAQTDVPRRPRVRRRRHRRAGAAACA